MRQQEKDERVRALTTKINAQAYYLAMILIFASMIVKLIMVDSYNAIFELICIFVPSAYIIVKNILAGNNPYKNKPTKKKIAIGILAGVTVSAFVGLNITSPNGELRMGVALEGIVSVLLGITAGVGVSLLIALISKKAAAKREAEILGGLDEE